MILTEVEPGKEIRWNDFSFTPIPLLHGSLSIAGYRWEDCAYLTDCSKIPEASYPLLDGVELLIIDALRYRPHPTHFSLGEALEAAKRIAPRQTYLTHLAHDFDHTTLERDLPEGILPAYDGLTLDW